jgi:RHS repeat-associated protein
MLRILSNFHERVTNWSPEMGTLSLWEFVSRPEAHPGYAGGAPVPLDRRWGLFQSIYRGLKQEQHGALVESRGCPYSEDSNARVQRPPRFGTVEQLNAAIAENLNDLQNSYCPVKTQEWLAQIRTRCDLAEDDPKLAAVTPYLTAFCIRDFGPGNPLLVLSDNPPANDVILSEVRNILGTCYANIAGKLPPGQTFCNYDCCLNRGESTCLRLLLRALAQVLPKPVDEWFGLGEGPEYWSSHCGYKSKQAVITSKDIVIGLSSGREECAITIVNEKGESVTPAHLSIDPNSFTSEPSPSFDTPPPPLPYLGFSAMASRPGTKPFKVYFFSNCQDKKVDLGQICQPATPALGKCLAPVIEKFWRDPPPDFRPVDALLEKSCTAKNEPAGSRYAGSFLDPTAKGRSQKVECNKRQRPGPCTRDLLERYEQIQQGSSLLSASQPSLLGNACYSLIEDPPSWSPQGLLRFERSEAERTVGCVLGFYTDRGQTHPLSDVLDFIGDPMLLPVAANVGNTIGSLQYTGVAILARTTPESFYGGAEVWLYLYSNCALDREDDCHTIRTDFPTDDGDAPGDCVTDASATQDQDAKINRETKLGDEETRYRLHHENQCLDETQITEIWKYTATTAEHHYTLFQYDGAGNLVEVTPPKGVAALVNTATRPARLMANRYKYNSRELIVEQSSPDTTGSKKLWYNAAGRLRFSQSAAQRPLLANDKPRYSYTKYDRLARITETGQVEASTVTWEPTSALEDNDFPRPVQTGFTRSEVTEFNYDQAPKPSDSRIGNWCRELWSEINTDNTVGASKPTYLRGRLVTTIRDNGALGNVVTCHNYDSNGLLITLVQHNLYTGAKRLDYDYDRVRADVKSTHYQMRADGSDRLHHRYEYDLDRRMKSLHTSRDGAGWERDAGYHYYPHGPLRRMELGVANVQGVDYALTLQSWLRGINRDTLDLGTTLDVARDIGKDGAAPGVPTSSQFGRDAFGLTLGYFPGDYKSILEARCAIMTPPPANCWVPFKVPTSGSAFASNAPGLYNGAITHAVVANRAFLESGKLLDDGKGILGSAYCYDQLYRLVGARAHTGIDSSSTTWPPADSTTTSSCTSPAARAYDMTVLDHTPKPSVSGYDANGNFLKVQRRGVAPTPGGSNDLDDLTYEYTSNTNKLTRVQDNVATPNYAGDLETQATNNYTYDADGNLKQDLAEGITDISWNSYGRPTQFRKSDGRTIQYVYDGDQKRIGVVESSPSSSRPNQFFIRDADGAIVAAYAQTAAPGPLSVSALPIRGINRLGAWQRNPVSGALAKHYEMHDRVSSVLSAVSSTRNPSDVDASIVGALDYYPFGMEMPLRQSGIRSPFGYHDHERADEPKGGGTAYIAHARLLDSRLGRWLSPDPLVRDNPAECRDMSRDCGGYAFSNNSPTNTVDPDGRAGRPPAPAPRYIQRQQRARDRELERFEREKNLRDSQTGATGTAGVATTWWQGAGTALDDALKFGQRINPNPKGEQSQFSLVNGGVLVVQVPVTGNSLTDGLSKGAAIRQILQEAASLLPKGSFMIYGTASVVPLMGPGKESFILGIGADPEAVKAFAASTDRRMLFEERGDWARQIEAIQESRERVPAVTE